VSDRIALPITWKVTMKWNTGRAILLVVGLTSPILRTVSAGPSLWAAPSEAFLPAGAKVVWDLDKAHREKTSTRERVCLNGLWRWQPAKEVTDSVPATTRTQLRCRWKTQGLDRHSWSSSNRRARSASSAETCTLISKALIPISAA
jgi:hypothetical protein